MYWPDDAPGARRQRLLEVWSQIVGLLDAQIPGVKASLALPPIDARGHEMKGVRGLVGRRGLRVGWRMRSGGEGEGVWG